MPVPPISVAKHAALGLMLRREFLKGGTTIGVARARDLSNRKNIPLKTLNRMYSYFSRHSVDKNAEGFYEGERRFPTRGRIAWELWGGDPGFKWVKKLLKK